MKEYKEVLSYLIENKLKYINIEKEINEFGDKMFIFATEKGLPPEMFIDEITKKINFNKEIIFLIISRYFDNYILHKRKSGALEKNIKKQQLFVNKKLLHFIKSGEFETI